jgi:hypothetical protein
VASRVQNRNIFEHMFVLHNPLYGGKIMMEYADDIHVYLCGRDFLRMGHFFNFTQEHIHPAA